jgi:hypothetical protein
MSVLTIVAGVVLVVIVLAVMMITITAAKDLSGKKETYRPCRNKESNTVGIRTSIDNVPPLYSTSYKEIAKTLGYKYKPNEEEAITDKLYEYVELLYDGAETVEDMFDLQYDDIVRILGYKPDSIRRNRFNKYIAEILEG